MSSAEAAVAEAPEKPDRPKLVLVEQGEDVNVNVFLYGPPKTGKTIGAASAPKPLLLLNAEGNPNSTRLAHTMHEFDEAKIENVETLIAAVYELETGKYKTVVVDPLAPMYRVLLGHLSNDAFRPTLNQYGDTGTHLERFCKKLIEMPINVVLVTHEITMAADDDGTIERLPFTGTKNPAIGLNLLSEVDVIGYTGTVEQDDGPPKYVAQLINARGRRGGDRFDTLGVSRELNLTEWVDLAHEATKKAPKGQKE